MKIAGPLRRVTKTMLHLYAYIFLLHGAAQGAIQKEFWVSPSGSDSNVGTLAAPFKTITKARDSVRPYLSNMTGDIVVYLRAGDYFLDSTVTFNNSDSGTGDHTVIYKNYDAVGSARIILGSRLNGGWGTDPSVLYAWTNSIGTGLSLISIFEGEKRGFIARYPNKNVIPSFPSSLGEYCIAESGSSNYIKYFPNQLNPETWTDISNLQICLWDSTGYRDWGLYTYDVSGITTNRNIYVSGSFLHTADSGDRYFLQNNLQFLDAPGEFYYDPASGLLRYIPYSGANPGTNVIVAGSSSVAFRLQGSAVGNLVRNICFEGLYFWCAPYGLYLCHTENIDIIDCHFKFMDREAIRMQDDNVSNLVYGCWIEHCGGAGIFIYNSLNRTTYPSNKSTGHIIENCKIQNLTEVTCNAVENAGVTIWNASSCRMLHCEIFNAARYGISLRGHYSTESTPNDNGRHYSVSNVFESTEIYNVGSDSGDMGAIHAAAVNPTGGPYINYWRNLTVDHVTAHPSMQDIKPNGIFLDHAHSTENQSFQNIKISNTQSIPYRTNNNPIQTLVNCSWIAGFDESLLVSTIGLEADFPSVYASSTTPSPTNEADYLRGQIVKDDGDSGYSESGTWVNSTIGGTINGDARYNNNNAGDYCQWTPTIPVSGRYGVYVWKFNNYSTALSAVNFQVQFSGGTLNHWVDQANPVTSSYWEKLGTCYFDAGSSGYVKAIAGTPKYVDSHSFRVDAVKFVPEVAVVPEVYWTFDETSGYTAYDSTLNGHDGTLLGNSLPVQTTGRIGNCLEFNGSSSYISVPDHNNLDMGTNDMTISVWFLRHSNAAGNLRILSKGAHGDSYSGYAIYGSDTSIAVAIGNGTTRIIKTITHSGVGQWNHLVVSMNRDGFMELYLNGQYKDHVDISAFDGDNIQNSWPLEIGRSVNGVAYWDGEIDDVRIFRRTIGSEDVESMYRVQ